MPRIAYLVSSATEIELADGSRHPTGYFAEEAIKPYQRFVAAGAEVVVITPDGRPPTADPYGLEHFFHYPEEDQDFLASVTRTFHHDPDDIRITLHQNTELGLAAARRIAERLRRQGHSAAEAHKLDDSRLVSAALLVDRKDEGGKSVFDIDDPLIPSLDVVAVNTYNGWYSEDPLPSLPDFVWHSSYDKPLVFSEFGAGATAGFHDSARTHKFSEEFQADYYRYTLAMAATIPFLRGMSPWILKDFRSPRRQHPIYQQGWNRKGLESPTGVRKQAFGVLAAFYADLEKRGRTP